MIGEFRQSHSVLGVCRPQAKACHKPSKHAPLALFFPPGSCIQTDRLDSGVSCCKSYFCLLKLYILYQDSLGIFITSCPAATPQI